MKLYIVYMHYNNPPMILFGETRAKVGRTVKSMLGPDMVNEVVPISNQDAEAQFGTNYKQQAQMNMLRSETVSVLTGDNPFIREKAMNQTTWVKDVGRDAKSLVAAAKKNGLKAKATGNKVTITGDRKMITKTMLGMRYAYQAFSKGFNEDTTSESTAKSRHMAIEGAMKRIATQDAEKERLGDRKVKGDGMDTFKKKYPDHLTLKKARAAFAPTKGGADVKKEDVKLSEAAVDQKLIKTLKAMMKDGDAESVRLLIQGLPRNMKKDVMKKIGMKEQVDGRTKAFKETIQRLNMAKTKTVEEDLDVPILEDESSHYKMTYTKHHTKDNKLHLDVHHTAVDFKGERPNNTPRVKKLVTDSPQHKEMKAKGFSISKYGEHDDHPNHESIHGNKPTITKESVNEKTLEELSKKTMGSYINKAVKSKGNAETRDGVGTGKAFANDTWTDERRANDNHKLGSGYNKPDRNRKIKNRSSGIERAADKMSAESNQVDELSKKTLGNYVKKASDDHSYKSNARGLNHTDPESHNDDNTTNPTSNQPTDAFLKKRVTRDRHGLATGSAHTVASKQAALKKDISNREKGIATAVKKMSEKTADEQEAEGGGHIVMQLRKSVSMRGQKDVKFNDGSTHKVSAAHADKFLSKHASLKSSHEKRDLQNKAAKSHDHLQKSISEDDIEEKTPIRATIQDKKLKNLRVPNPNYKKMQDTRPERKKKMSDAFEGKDEVGIDKPEEATDYTSMDFFRDYIKATNKK